MQDGREPAPSERVALMIPGATDDGPTLEVRSPFDRSLVGRVACASRSSAERALATAKRLFDAREDWIPVDRRVGMLERAAAIVLERAEELALGIAREGGKPLVDARVEVARAADGLKLCAIGARSAHGSEVPMTNAASAHRLAFTTREPIGPVLAISAFNHPLNLIVHQAGPAIAAGAPVVIKPAEATPITALAFARIVHEAGLPPEWCQVLVTEDLDLVGALVADPRVAFLSFIGSARVGWTLRAKLAPGTRCALEHGGAAPVIVAADADLAAYLPLLVKGAFYHAGQVCVSVQRVFAHASIARAFAVELAERAARLVVGDPTDPRTEVGPLIREREVSRIAEWIDEARGRGAEVLCGGRALSSSCYAPTVLLDPPEDARVSREEVFGPVVCVYTFERLDDAIERANALPFAFQAAIATRDVDTAMAAARRLAASAVMINDVTTFRVDWMPFAGLRQSGLGVGGIDHTLREMQVEKLIVLRSQAF